MAEAEAVAAARTAGYGGRQDRALAVAAVVAFALTVGVGWLSGARVAVYAIMASLGVVLLLPIGLMAVSSLVLGVVLLPLEVVPPYYRWLGAQRHPRVLGGALGALLGCLALWGLVSVLVVPREVETLRRMAAIQADADAAVERGELPRQPEALDAFGRPLELRADRKWALVWYELRSLGHDGRRSLDDLCVHGANKAARAAGRFVATAHAVALARAWLDPDASGAVPFGDQADLVLSLRCD